jgi:hypothetical protein
MRRRMQSRRVRMAHLIFDLIVWACALVMLLITLSGCASCPPCQSCPTCNANLQECERDLDACSDLAERCYRELE